MSRIKIETENRIKEVADIKEVVEDFVKLRRRGTNWIGLCPFHHEKTPSFNVSPTKGIFKCFGCGEAGDAVSFVMKHEHLSYPEALRYLARKYGIEIEEEEWDDETRARQQRLDSLYLVNDFARSFFEHNLHETDEGKSIGLSYFKQRGFREDIIRKYQLGYALRQRDALVQAARAKGYNPEHLEALGLMRNGRDFFVDRVMFPIHNMSGKVIAFAGRILRKDAKAPKYINSPETEIYHKSQILYGIHQARGAIRKEGHVILVEGYTDVLSLAQEGIQQVVASSGTSLTEGQVHLLKRLTEDVWVIYDGDAAGVNAAIRGLGLLLEFDLNVRVVVLPEGEDPDSYVQKTGGEGFMEYVRAEGKDLVLFHLSQVEGRLRDPIEKTKAVKEVVETIARIPQSSKLKRDQYLRECARLMDVGLEALIYELNRLDRARLRKEAQKQGVELPAQAGPEVVKRPSRPGTEPAAETHETQERDLVRVLLTFADKQMDPETGDTVADFIFANIEPVLLDLMDDPVAKKVIEEMWERYEAGQSLDAKFFLKHHGDEQIRRFAADLLFAGDDYSPGWDRHHMPLVTQPPPEENFVADAEKALLNFKLRKVIRLLAQKTRELAEAEKRGDENQVQTLLQQVSVLQKAKVELAKTLGVVVV